MNTLKKECKKFGLLLMALAMVASFILPGASYARAGELAMLTMKSEYFTYIAKGKGTFEFEVTGLDKNYNPVGVEARKVRVKSSNKHAVQAKVNNKQGKAMVKVNIAKLEDAVITISYADSKVDSVTSNVFVDSEKPTANNVILKVEGYPDQTVTVNKGLPDGYGAVLQNAPTALGALKAGGYTLDVSNGYLQGINGKMATWSPYHGWKYKVNGVEPAFGVGVYRINSGDKVEFIYE